MSPPHCYRCDYEKTYPSCNVHCVSAIEQMIEFEGAETVAAVIASRLRPANGSVSRRPKYWPLLREICDRHGVLLIVDEVIMADDGKCSRREYVGVVPDMMTWRRG